MPKYSFSMQQDYNCRELDLMKFFRFSLKKSWRGGTEFWHLPLRKAVILLNARQLFITWFRPSSVAGKPCFRGIFAIRVQPDVREKIGLFALVNNLNSRKSNWCSRCITLDKRSYSSEVKVELTSILVGSFARA